MTPVAPLVGAWIETRETSYDTLQFSHVAPLVGAWIETHIEEMQIRSYSVSLPSWERGLKPILKHEKRIAYRGRSPRGSVD